MIPRRDSEDQPERLASGLRAREHPLVEVLDVRGVLDESEVPVRLERPELRRPEEPKRSAGRERLVELLVLDRVLEDLADRRVRGGVAGHAPRGDALCEFLVQFAHGVLESVPSRTTRISSPSMSVIFTAIVGPAVAGSRS